MTEVLGRGDDAVCYRTLSFDIRAAFTRCFVTSEGVIFNPGRSSDVTAIVRGLVKDQRLTVKVRNEILGDPAPNVLKRLRLTYKIGYRRETQDYPEDTMVDLSGGGQRLEIVSAVFGENSADPKSADVQGSYALALQFGLLDEPLRSRAVKRLVQVIQRDSGHPTTGFWSNVELLLALSENGCHDIAAQMLSLMTVPAWGHMVQGDGTTFWESFTADTHNLSLNHWTHSAIGEWLWRHIAGIAPDPDQPGYRSVLIRPRPCAEVDSCQASYESPRGPVSVAWNHSPAEFTLDVTIPANMIATVFVPTNATAQITEGGRPAASSLGIHLLRSESENCVYRVAAGTYQFAVRQS